MEGIQPKDIIRFELNLNTKQTLEAVLRRVIPIKKKDFTLNDIFTHKDIAQKLLLEEFDKAQIILGRRGKPRPKKHEFAFTSLIRCGECGAMITAEEKWKKQKNGNVHHYIYYHCTKKKNPNCTQGSIEIKELEKQIDELLAKIEINERYKDFAIKYLNKTNDSELASRKSILESQQKEYKRCLTEIDNLLKLRISPENTDGSLLNDEEYKKQKAELIQKKTRFEEHLNDTGQRIEQWMSIAEQVYDFACFARIRFAKGDSKTKRDILSALGQNLLLKDGKLAVQLKKPFQIIVNTLTSVPEAKRGLEPVKMGKNELKTADLTAVNPSWLALADDFRTLRWEEVFGYPEGVLKQMKELLATV